MATSQEIPKLHFSNAIRYCFVAILLALFAIQVIFAVCQMSPGVDETALIPTGYTFLKTGQWHLVPEHPPLIFAAFCASATGA